MKLNRKSLIAALQAVSVGLAKKEVIAQSTCFVFTEDGQVVTYNDEIAVSHPIKVGFTGAVAAKELLAILNKTKAEEIELELKSGELFFKGSRAKAGLRVQSDIELPITDLAQPEESDWKKLPANFCEALSFCLFSVSKDQNKQLLTCVHIRGQFAESSDNFRVTVFDMGKDALKVFKKNFLVPAHAAKSVVSYKPVKYAMTEGWLHFKTDTGMQFSCRTFDEDYPNVEKILNVKGNKLQFPSKLGEIMDRASIFSEEAYVTISIEENKLTVSAEGLNGWFKEESRISYAGEATEFDIAPEFMKSIMKINDTAIVGEKLLKFEGEDFVHVVARIKKQEKKK